MVDTSMCVPVRNRPGVLEGYSFQKRGAELDCQAPRADAGRPHGHAGENAHEQNYIFDVGGQLRPCARELRGRARPDGTLRGGGRLYVVP